MSELKHGKSIRGQIHPLYRKWAEMLSRCYHVDERSKNFPRYRGRGILVCAQWSHSFEAFYRDMAPSWKPGLTLDRIDNNGHYNRQNCRWIPFKHQARNRRNNRIVTIDGITGCLAEVCEKLGVPYNLMCNHLQIGKRSLQEIADFLRLPREERERIRVASIFGRKPEKYPPL